MFRNFGAKYISYRNLPALVILLVVVVYTFTNFSHKDWTEKGMKGVIRWDIISYYGYLPATFIYHDASLSFLDDPNFVNDNKFWYVTSDNGSKVILTSMGLSYLYAPFFFLADAIAPHIGQARDGFSPVYQFCLVFSSLFYLIIGLIVLRNLLSRYFSTLAVTVTLFLVAFGTNLYKYGTYDAPMSHSYNFVLIIVFLWAVIQWYKKPAPGMTILTGFLLGLIAIIRPSNVLAVIILVLWGVDSFPALWERIKFFWSHSGKIGLMILAFFIPWVPQFIYWYSLTGHLFYNAYQNTGSAFFFGSPHVTDLLFSYRKGWFLYVPVMFFAAIGLIPLYRRWRKQFWMVTVYIVVMVYVLASWWAWWYGGSFGPRALIDTYGIMAFPLAAIIHTAFERKLAVKIGVFVISGFLVYVNFFQTIQYQRGLIHYLGMTRQAYWNNFLTMHPKKSHWKMLSIPDMPLARKGIYYNYHTSDTFDAFKDMTESEARDSVRKEVLSRPHLMKEIRRYARQNDITVDSSVNMVVNRVAEEKMEGKPF